MKSCFFLSLLIVISYSSYSQISHVEILLGKNETAIRQYFDSLNNLKPNSASKIQTNVSVGGLLMLENSFNPLEEEYYSCVTIVAKFTRVKGVELCVQQLVVGTNEFAQSNLSFVKDNFAFVSPGLWEKDFPIAPNYNIRAAFESDKNKIYTIKYDIQKKQENK